MTGHGADPALLWPQDYFYHLLTSGRLARLAREGMAYWREFGRRPYFGLRSKLLARKRPLDSFPKWLNPEFAAQLDLTNVRAR